MNGFIIALAAFGCFMAYAKGRWDGAEATYRELYPFLRDAARKHFGPPKR